MASHSFKDTLRVSECFSAIDRILYVCMHVNVKFMNVKFGCMYLHLCFFFFFFFLLFLKVKR